MAKKTLAQWAQEYSTAKSDLELVTYMFDKLSEILSQIAHSRYPAENTNIPQPQGKNWTTVYNTKDSTFTVYHPEDRLLKQLASLLPSADYNKSGGFLRLLIKR